MSGKRREESESVFSSRRCREGEKERKRDIMDAAMTGGTTERDRLRGGMESRKEQRVER